MLALPVLALVACLCMLFAVAPAPTVAGPPSAMVKKLNKTRHHRGLPPLKRSPALMHSARRYARHLMSVDRFAHPARIWAPPRFSTVGETLMLGTGWRVKPRRAVLSWLRSGAHRPLLLSRRFGQIGAGRARGRFGGRRATIWVLHFGRRGGLRSATRDPGGLEHGPEGPVLAVETDPGKVVQVKPPAVPW